MAWEIYQLCSNQWRFVEGRLAGLDYNVVFKVMEFKGAGFEEFQKVRLIESEMLSSMRAQDIPAPSDQS